MRNINPTKQGSSILTTANDINLKNKTMKTLLEQTKEIYEVVDTFKRVQVRVNKLTEMGYFCAARRCGSGGIKRLIKTKNETRIQIGFGHGKYNYAMCVIIPANQ